MVMVLQIHLQLCQGSWLAALDLQDVYWNVTGTDSGGHFTVLCVTFQAIDISPRVFTKLTTQVYKLYADQSFNALFYLDDWLIISPSTRQEENPVALVKRLAENMGLFRFNLFKASLLLCQSLMWLRMNYDMLDMLVSLSVDNLHKVTKIR